MDVDQLLKRFFAQDTIALAKVISLIENRAPGYQEILDALYPKTGGAYRVGITGPPGAGKSSLVDKLTPLYRAEGKRVAIIACDPTSPFTGGALLGDRIRMQDLISDDGVYIRSMATRGSLGGLAQSAHEVAIALDAFGFDLILLETIGVGQVEVDIAQAGRHGRLSISSPIGRRRAAMKRG